VARHHSHLYYNHECIRQIKTPINDAAGRGLARKFGFQCLKLRIQNSHKRIKCCERTSAEILDKLKLKFSTNWVEKLLKHLSAVPLETKKVLRRKHDRLTSSLIESTWPARKRKNTLINDNEKRKWVGNLSKNFRLSETQTTVLKLGLNFAVSLQKLPTHRILAAAEKVYSNSS